MKEYEKKYDKMWNDIKKRDTIHVPINELKENVEKHKKQWAKEYAEWMTKMHDHHKKLLEHSLERLKTYYNEPTFTVTALDESREFSNWINFVVPKIGS